MTTLWLYDGTKDQSKFSLEAVVSKLSKQWKVEVTMVEEGKAILNLKK